jgi:hypothetical protein
LFDPSLVQPPLVGGLDIADALQVSDLEVHRVPTIRLDMDANRGPLQTQQGIPIQMEEQI